MNSNIKVQEVIDKNKESEDKNKIVNLDMKENQYFLNEQDGYTYNSAENFKYFSKVLEKERYAKVLLPENYNKDKEYNLLVLLHGYKGSKNTWLNKRADTIIQNSMYFEKMPETITVFVDSNLNESEGLYNYEFFDAVKYFDRTEEEVIESLMPALENEYKLKDGKNNKAIAGQSLGGRNAIKISFDNYDIFGYVGAFGPSKLIKDNNPYFDGFFESFNNKKLNELKHIFICVGKSDDVVGYEVARFKNKLEYEGINFIYSEFDGAHDDRVWILGLYNFLRIIFKEEIE